MALVTTDNQHYNDIADSIRAQLGVQTTYLPSEMAAAIEGISGGSATLVTKTITENGTYDPADDSADGYSEVTVNVSGTSGVTFSENQPTSGDGSNGDYWYVIDDAGTMFNYTPDQNAQSAVSAGIEFTVSDTVTVKGLSIYGRSSNSKGEVHLYSYSSSSEIASASDIPITAGAWNDVSLSEPVTLNAGSYLVWGCMNSTAMMYKQSGSSPISGVTYTRARYINSRSTLPTTQESNTVYGVNVIVGTEDMIVNEQWRKKSGSWTQIA